MPFDFAALGGGCKEQAGAVKPVGLAEAQGPVLIVRSGGFWVGATFSDEVDVLALMDGVGSDPRFEGDGIAVFEIEDAIGAGVVYDDAGSVARECNGAVGLSESRVVGASGARYAGANFSHEGERACVFGVKSPVSGFVGRCSVRHGGKEREGEGYNLARG